MCLKILSNSMSLIYNDHTEIIVNLVKSLKGSIENVKDAENSVILLNYLSTSENLKKIVENDNEDQRKSVFMVVDLCCEIASNDLVKNAASHITISKRDIS